MLDSLDHLGVDRVDEMAFLPRKYLAWSLCDLHGAVEYAGVTTARCSGDQVAASSRGRVAGVVQGRGRRAVPVLVAASRRCQRLPFDRTRMRWGALAAVNLVKRAASPHLLFIGLRDGAHQPHLELGVPDQNASQGPSLPLGQLVEINTNTPSPSRKRKWKRVLLCQ